MGCRLDHQCKMRVNDTWIIFAEGLVQNVPRGKVTGIEENHADEYVGSEVEVFGKKFMNVNSNTEEITIYGSPDYYIKLIKGARKPIEKTITGVVTHINKGCYGDATCEMTIGNDTVIFGEGNGPGDPGNPKGLRGKIIGIDENDIEQLLNKKVEAFVRLIPERFTYTLYGSDKYYIKLLP
jgi:hypothetical protein